MLRLELPLEPLSAWDSQVFNDWSAVINSLMIEKGWMMRPAFQIPGYEILEFAEKDGREKEGEIIFSAAERAVILLGFSARDDWERDFIHSVLHLARDMGAVSLFTYAEEENLPFWQGKGARILPEMKDFPGPVRPEQIGVVPLYEISLLVTYEGIPALCLEPIVCNHRPSRVISIAQRKIERLLGGYPLGFASRVASHCPWNISRCDWDELLAYSRLMAFETIACLVEEKL